MTPLLEMGEEAGPPGLHAFCAAQRQALQADLLIEASVFKRPFPFPMAPRTRPTRMSRSLKVAETR